MIPNNSTNQNIRQNKSTEDQVLDKLKDIRSKTTMPPPSTRETIEKSIEHLISQGLSLTEAVEYEANQSRLRQLKEKMNTRSQQNQYNGKQAKHND